MRRVLLAANLSPALFDQLPRMLREREARLESAGSWRGECVLASEQEIGLPSAKFRERMERIRRAGRRMHEARNELAQRNLKLVVKVAKEFRGMGFSFPGGGGAPSYPWVGPQYIDPGQFASVFRVLERDSRRFRGVQRSSNPFDYRGHPTASEHRKPRIRSRVRALLRRAFDLGRPPASSFAPGNSLRPQRAPTRAYGGSGSRLEKKRQKNPDLIWINAVSSRSEQDAGGRGNPGSPALGVPATRAREVKPKDCT